MPDTTPDLELIAVDLEGHRSALGTIERALVDTVTLDAPARALYVTSVGTHHAHNVLKVSLDDGGRRWLTDNTLAGVSFSKTHVLSLGNFARELAWARGLEVFNLHADCIGGQTRDPLLCYDDAVPTRSWLFGHGAVEQEERGAPEQEVEERLAPEAKHDD